MSPQARTRVRRVVTANLLLTLLGTSCAFGDPSATLSLPAATLAMLQPLVSSADNSILSVVCPTMPVPDYRLKDLDASIFDTVPKSSQLFDSRSEGDPTGKTIPQILADLAPLVQVGIKPVPDDKRADYAAQEKVLYKNSEGDPTDHYAEYEEINKKIADLIQKSNQETSPALQNVLRSQIASLRRDLATRFFDVIQALNFTKQFDTKETLQQLNQWRSSWSSVPKITSSPIRNGLANTSGWSELTFSTGQTSSAAGSGQATVDFHEFADIKWHSIDDPKTEQTAPLPTAITVSMSVNQVLLDRPFFRNRWTNSKSWRLKNQTILSNGSGGGSGGDEKIPRLISAVFVANHIEIYFDQEKDWQAIAQIIDKAAYLRVGQFLIKRDKDFQSYLSSRVLFINSPQIIAVLIKPLPKLPDPAPDIQW